MASSWTYLCLQDSNLWCVCVCVCDLFGSCISGICCFQRQLGSRCLVVLQASSHAQHICVYVCSWCEGQSDTLCSVLSKCVSTVIAFSFYPSSRLSYLHFSDAYCSSQQIRAAWSFLEFLSRCCFSFFFNFSDLTLQKPVNTYYKNKAIPQQCMYRFHLISWKIAH